MKEKCENCSNLKLIVELILFGNEENTKTDDAFDQIILLAKYFIYKCRIDKIKPNIEHFLKELKTSYDAEKYSHSLETTYTRFVKKWYPYQQLVHFL